MAQKLDPKQTISFEDLLLSNTFEQAALVEVLVKKGIVTKEEILEEIERLKNEPLK